MNRELDCRVHQWLARLAAGDGRAEELSGQQRHFLRVLAGEARPLGDEKVWLHTYHGIQAALNATPACPEAQVERNGLESLIASNGSTSIADVNMLANAGYEERYAAAAMYRAAARWPPSSERVAAPAAMNRIGSAQATELPNFQPYVPKNDDETAEFIALMWAICNLIIYRGVKKEGAMRTGAMGISQTVAQGLKDGARLIGDALHGVGQSEGAMKGGVATAVKGGGAWIADGAAVASQELRRARGWIGQSAEDGRQQLEAYAERKSSEGSNLTAGLVRQIGGAAVSAAAVAGKALAGLGELSAISLSAAGRSAVTHGDLVGGAAAGATGGAATMLGGTVDLVGISEADIEMLRSEITAARAAAFEQRKRYEVELRDAERRGTDGWLENFTIGGLLLADILASHDVPPEIAAAYSAAFPAESQLLDFSEKIDSLGTDEQISGLLNAVKGKLFEQKFLDDLNASLEPVGSHAFLAPSATQPGWDIFVTDKQGHIDEFLSLKATDSVAYVKEALERYPDIDVVSTSEVYGALAGTPDGARLIDGGIENSDLSNAVHEAGSGDASTIDHMAFSLVALLPAAYRYFSESGKTTEQMTMGLTRHVGRTKSAAMIGKAAMLVMPYWPIAVLASTGVSMLGRIGNDRREQFVRLKNMLTAIRGGSRTLVRKRQVLKLRKTSIKPGA